MVNNVETVLVILLAVGFLTLIILSIILVSITLAVMKNVKRISDRAEEATANVSELAALLGRKVAPLAVSAMVAAMVRRFRGKKE